MARLLTATNYMSTKWHVEFVYPTTERWNGSIRVKLASEITKEYIIGAWSAVIPDYKTSEQCTELLSLFGELTALGFNPEENPHPSTCHLKEHQNKNATLMLR